MINDFKGSKKIRQHQKYSAAEKYSAARDTCYYKELDVVYALLDVYY